MRQVCDALCDLPLHRGRLSERIGDLNGLGVLRRASAELVGSAYERARTLDRGRVGRLVDSAEQADRFGKHEDTRDVRAALGDRRVHVFALEPDDEVGVRQTPGLKLAAAMCAEVEAEQRARSYCLVESACATELEQARRVDGDGQPCRGVGRHRRGERTPKSVSGADEGNAELVGRHDLTLTARTGRAERLEDRAVVRGQLVGGLEVGARLVGPADAEVRTAREVVEGSRARLSCDGLFEERRGGFGSGESGPHYEWVHA